MSGAVRSADAGVGAVGLSMTGGGRGLLARLIDVAAFRRALGAAGRPAALVSRGADPAPDAAIAHGVFIRCPENVRIGARTPLSGHVRIEAWGKVTSGRCCVFNDDVLVLTAQHDIDSAVVAGNPERMIRERARLAFSYVSTDR